MLEIRNLTKTFGKKNAIDDVSLTLEPRTYGLLGPNGAGKTTLIRCLTLLYPEGERTVYYAGKLVAQQSDYVKKIGYLPQQFGLFRELTVKDMLLMLAHLRGMSKNEASSQIEPCLARVNLESQVKAKVGSLSGGMLRRLGIAQTFLGLPEFLFYDEPTSGLDPEERLRFKNVIADAQLDKTILISTHIVEDIDAVCDSTIVLNEGRILFVGTNECLKNLAAERVYDIPERILPQLNDVHPFRKYIVNGDVHYRVLAKKRLDLPASPPTLEDGYLSLVRGLQQ